MEHENFMSAMQYIVGLREATDIESCFDTFDCLIKELGFIGHGYASGIGVGQIGGDPGLMSNSLPDAWKAEYFSKGYIHSDPVLEWCMSQQAPATWEIIKRELGKEKHPIWEEAASYGMVDGVAMPIIFSDKIGLISIASHKPVGRSVFAIVKPLARYFTVAIHFLSNNDRVPILDDPRFTYDDLKILSMIRIGYSDQQIAENFKVARSTITRKINRLMSATYTNNRTLAATIFEWSCVI